MLNAKNDEEEAGIIAGAGKLNAITISTNMAGRGVDIALGGKDKKQYQQVVALGGLFVIGTNRHDSLRIDHQLRGRSGRQGDPGESVFYISLEDPIFTKHRIRELSSQKPKKGGSGPITSKALQKAVAHAQKRVEEQTLDVKISLSRYSLLYEQQRQIAHQMRESVLNDTKIIGESGYFPDKVIKSVSSDELSSALKVITLYAINNCWSDHLMNMEAASDEVQAIGRFTSDPFDAFNRKLIEYFSTFETDIHDNIIRICKEAVVKNNHIDLEMMGIKAPASTKTYMLLDGTENINLINGLAAAANPMTAFLFFIYMLSAHFWKRKKRVQRQ